MSTQLTKAASELKPGDRITAGFLPLADAADVLFVEHYTGRDGQGWTFVAHRADGYGPESDVFAAAARIPVEPVDTGLGYSREADDPTPVSPARVPLLTGAVVDGNALVVDEPAACTCNTDPLGCVPHGPSARASLAVSTRTS